MTTDTPEASVSQIKDLEAAGHLEAETGSAREAFAAAAIKPNNQNIVFKGSYLESLFLEPLTILAT
jgi:hypothetical protein